MKITSYPITRDIRIGRIKSDPCEIVFVLNEDGTPMDLTGKVLELVFLTGNHAMLTLSPDDIDGNKAVFALTEEEKNKLYANLIYISVKLDGVTIGEGRFEWGSTHGDKSELPKAIGINVNNVTESIEWFEVIVGPRGEKGELTEEDKALLDSKVQDAESAKNTALGASVSASNAASSANSAAITAGNAATAAGGSATAAGNSATAASGSATSASNSAASAVTAKDQAIVAKNAAELAAATIDKNGEVVEGDVRLVSGDKVYSSVAPIKRSIIISPQLFDKETDQIEVGTLVKTGLNPSDHNFRVRKSLSVGVEYTISGEGSTPTSPTTLAKVLFFNVLNEVIGYVAAEEATKKICTFTVPANTSYVYIQLGRLVDANTYPLRNNNIVNTAMLNHGSQAAPYEVYGDSRINTEKIDRYSQALELVDAEILVDAPKKNLINPESINPTKKYSLGSSSVANRGAEIYMGSGYIAVAEGEWYTYTIRNGATPQYIGGYFSSLGQINAIQGISWVTPVDGVGRSFQVPIGMGIHYVYLDLLATDFSGSILHGQHQLEKGEKATSYEPYEAVRIINPAYTPVSAPAPSNSDALARLTSFDNLSYSSISDKIPLFRGHWIRKDKDLVVVNTGTSLTARSTEHCTAHHKANERPPLLHSNNFATHIWDRLKWDNQYYRRYDFPGFFAETGSFQTQSNVAEWDDGAYRAGLTRYSDGAAASIAFQIPIGAWQFNFIFRADSVATESATITVAEGNGQLEVWNGTAWLEANGYVFSQREPAPTTISSLTNINPETGNPQVHNNYKTKGNTTYQKRLKMRCKSGMMDSRASVKSVSISAPSGRLTYWGTEWSKREFMITYINAARGSHSSLIDSSVCLSHFQDNEVWGFKPDLLLTEDPIHNAGAGGPLVLSRPKSYYARVTDNFFFAAGNKVSITASANRMSLPAPEMVIFNSSIAWGFNAISENGELIVYEIVDGQWTSMDAQMSCWEYVKEAYPNVIYINAVRNWVDSAIKIYGDLKTATQGSGKDGLTFTNEAGHWNDTGSRIMARVVLPVLDFIV